MRRRSGWTSTFVASLELAKLGEVNLAQAGTFATIRASTAHPS
jgi:chromatin segregation and condensation protein Rec8/ScpA/Scc1 (kleisin family)